MSKNNKRLEGVMSPLVKPEEADFGVSVGTDMTLPFATPYQPDLSSQSPINLSGVTYEVSPYEMENGPTVAQLERMRRKDGQATALHRLLTLPIRSSLPSASITPAEGGEREAEFIQDALFTPPSKGGMDVPFSRVMAQILESLFTGFAAFEKVYWRPTSGPLKGKITLKKLGHRPATSINFISDGNGEFAGMRQRIWSGPNYRDVFIKPQYSFYFAAQEELRKFYGVSFFQSAYYHWDKKNKLEYISHLAAQRSAVGTRVGKVPPGASASQKREFSAALANMALAQYLAVPENFEVEVLKEGGNFDFIDMINHHNSQMSKSVLANFFDQEQGSGASGGALVNFGGPGDDMFVLMLHAIMDEIASAINYFIIPPLIDYNWPNSKKYPQFTWGTLTDDQQTAVAKMFEKLAAAGQSLTVTPEFMRALEENMSETMGLDIDYGEVDAREEEEKALSEAQFAQEQGLEGLTGPDGVELPQAKEVTPEEAEASLADLESSLGVDAGASSPEAAQEADSGSVESKVGT